MLGRQAPPSGRSPAAAPRKRSWATEPATGRSVPMRTHSNRLRLAGTGSTIGPGPWRSTQPTALEGVGRAPGKTGQGPAAGGGRAPVTPDKLRASVPSAVNVQRPVLGGRTRRQTLAAAGQRATNG